MGEQVSVAETRVIMCELLPAGAAGALGFGLALKKMDLASCASAEAFAKASAVTVGIDEFYTTDEGRLRMGNKTSIVVLVCEATCNAAWRSSMEIGCRVSIELEDGSRVLLCSAYFTFCLLKRGSPLPTLTIAADEIDQQRRFTEAQERRAVRLTRKSLLESFSASNQNRLTRSDSFPMPIDGFVKEIDSPRNNRIIAGEFQSLNLVLPKHCNHHGNLFGGEMLEWALQAAFMASQRTCRTSCKLISSDDVFFFSPVLVGDRVTCVARCNRVFHGNKMEIGVRLVCRSCDGLRMEHALSAYFLISPESNTGNLTIGQIDPVTPDDLRRYKKAKSRQALRLQRQALKCGDSLQPLINPKDQIGTTHLILQNVAGLLRALNTSKFSPDAWETIVDDKVKVMVFHPTDVVASPNVVFLSIDIPCSKLSATDALRHGMQPELRKKWDLLFRDLKILETISNNDDIVLQTAGVGDKLVDFVLLRSWREDVQGAPGRLLMSSLSVEYEQAPESSNKRGQILSSGWVVDPRGESSCHIRYLMQMSNAGLQLIIGDMIGKSAVYASALRLQELGN